MGCLMCRFLEDIVVFLALCRLASMFAPVFLFRCFRSLLMFVGWSFDFCRSCFWGAAVGLGSANGLWNVHKFCISKTPSGWPRTNACFFHLTNQKQAETCLDLPKARSVFSFHQFSVFL